MKSRLTFVSLVPSLTLRAGLISIFPLIFITSAANWEGTFIASNKDITIGSHSNSISTNLTYLTIQILQWLWLHHKHLLINTKFHPKPHVPRLFCHQDPEERKTKQIKLHENHWHLMSKVLDKVQLHQVQSNMDQCKRWSLTHENPEGKVSAYHQIWVNRML